MQKLGKNNGRYLGETINIHSILQDVENAAKHHGWRLEKFNEIAGFPVFALHRSPAIPASKPLRIYLSAGIHGDEPAGPLAARELIRSNPWPDHAEIFLLPCLNPAGFTRNQRENPDGLDLNRDYRDSKSAECRAHVSWLERQPRFDCYFCLHEDWESRGFYLYEQNPENQPSLAQSMIDAVSKICPIDQSETIEGRPACGGIIRPLINPQTRPDWPEALYLISHKSQLGYTLEAPSDFPLETRVTALSAAIRTALGKLTGAQLEAKSP